LEAKWEVSPNLYPNSFASSIKGVSCWRVPWAGIKKENIFSCDINLSAVKHCKSLGFNCIESNLFKNIKGKFNLIIFNPPYLPEDPKGLEPEVSKLATTGGKNGNELILKFLREAKKYLEKDGKIFLLTSSLTPKMNFKKLGYKSKLLEKEKLFYEQLFVWELFV